MWKEPKIHSLDAPTDIKEIISKSVYWNSKGALKGSPSLVIGTYSAIIFALWLFIASTIYFILEGLQINNWLKIATQGMTMLGILISMFYYFYKWGWNNYREAWYNFDKENEIFTVVRKTMTGWETIEIPYEEIDSIDYLDGANGKAIIKSINFEFETNRARDKRRSSVTDIWDDLARTSTKMTNWPINLVCQKCKRKYGHHIGTAQCPFCRLILVDPQVKGRIDPQIQHPDDLDRI